MHLGIAECQVPVTMTSDLGFRIIVSGAYLLYYFKKGISNLVCGCILECSVLFTGHCDLKLDQLFVIIMVRAYLILFKESRIYYVNAFWDGKVSRPILGSP